jgi:hypothetical protein
MKSWIIERWDWLVYRLAYRTFRRMCERNGGFAYLFELYLRQWRSEHPIPDYVERATETFFEAIRDQIEKEKAREGGAA